MTPPRKDPAAVSLGRRGGKSRSDAKAAASRANGALGGRTAPLREVAGEEVHADAELAGRIDDGRPLLRASSEAARRWLQRQGYEPLWARRRS